MVNQEREKLIEKADRDFIEGKIDCMKYVDIINKFMDEESEERMKRNPIEEREYI